MIPLDDLFHAYRSDRRRVDPLLTDMRRIALWILRDEDAAQDALLDAWPMLADLELPEGATFFGWWVTRLTWRSVEAYRALQRHPVREEQPPLIEDGEGGTMTTDEALSAAAYHHSGTAEIPDVEDRIATIPDPLVRRAADMLLDGLTQTEVARRLEVSIGALKMRLKRFRQQNATKLVA